MSQLLLREPAFLPQQPYAGGHLDKLAGLHSVQSLSESMFGFHGRPYSSAGYTRTTTASTQQLENKPAKVVEALLGNLARGRLGLQQTLFPCQAPQEIQRRDVSS